MAKETKQKQSGEVTRPLMSKSRGPVKVLPSETSALFQQIEKAGGLPALNAIIEARRPSFRITIHNGHPVYEIKRVAYDDIRRLVLSNDKLKRNSRAISLWQCNKDDPYDICY